VTQSDHSFYYSTQCFYVVKVSYRIYYSGRFLVNNFYKQSVVWVGFFAFALFLFLFLFLLFLSFTPLCLFYPSVSRERITMGDYELRFFCQMKNG
jgi:hypothetical protein